MHNLLSIDWESSFVLTVLSTILSAFISTIFALIISWYFYRLGNKDAFKGDIISEIAKTNNPSETKKAIEECRHRYIYSLRGMNKYRDKIDILYSSCKKAEENSYENAFANFILNLFYKTINVERYHEKSIDARSIPIKEENYPDEPVTSLKRYAFYDDDGYEYVCEQKIVELLIDFYRENIDNDKGTIKKLHFLFGNNSMFDLFHASEEYNNYIKYESEYKSLITTF